MSFKITFCLLVTMTCCIWIGSPQVQGPNQYEQYQMQMANRMNGRGVQTVAFVMDGGHPNTGANQSQFITFDNTPLNNSARLIPNFAAFRATLPGLYFFSYRFRGANTSESTEIQLKIHQNATSTTTTADTTVTQGQQSSVGNTLAMLAVNDSVYLETTQGTLFSDSTNATRYNAFMGILMVAEQPNPFLGSLFNTNNVNNNNNNNNNNNLARNLQSARPIFL